MSAIPSEYYLHLGLDYHMTELTMFMSKYECWASFMSMVANNHSPYLSGYHGVHHVIKCINTLHKIYESTETETRQNINWKSMLLALIWHDFNYIDPENDSANTEVALQGFSLHYRLLYNTVPKEIEEYIRILEFPYAIVHSPAFPLEYYIVRDCDMSMILYEDYFETMYAGLLKNEFKNKKNLVESAIIFIENLQFHNADLKERLEKIGKDYLTQQALKCIVMEQRGKV